MRDADLGRNILDNTELIETLENAKVKVNEVVQALHLGERTRQDIEKLRDIYRLAARRGAVLYFSLIQMSSINAMVRHLIRHSSVPTVSSFSTNTP